MPWQPARPRVRVRVLSAGQNFLSLSVREGGCKRELAAWLAGWIAGWMASGMCVAGYISPRARTWPQQRQEHSITAAQRANHHPLLACHPPPTAIHGSQNALLYPKASAIPARPKIKLNKIQNHEKRKKRKGKNEKK